MHATVEKTTDREKYFKRIIAVFLCIVTMACSSLTSYASTGVVTETDTKDEETEGGTDTGVEPKIKVLMIGNSFTVRANYSVGKILEELAKDETPSISVKTIANPGAHLSFYAYWTSAYKNYYDDVMTTLKGEQYDYIILQDNTKSGIEAYETQMLPSTRQLCTYIHAYQPYAKVLLYETASFVDGSSTQVDGKEQELPLQEFQERTLYAYTRLQNDAQIEMVPVGMTVFHAGAMYPAINMVATDFKHPNYAGYYMAAASFYYRIYGKKPATPASELSLCKLIDDQLFSLNQLLDDRIVLNKSSLALAEGGSEQLWATIQVQGANGGSVSWKSLNPSIASVNAKTGKVTGESEGSTGIIAETTTGLMAVCCVTVKNTATTQLSFGRKEYKVMVGDRIRISANVKDWKADDTFVWSSSNPAVATVSPNGTASAHKMGSTVIKVKSKSNGSISARYTLHVTGPAPKALSVKVSSQTALVRKVKLSWRAVYGAAKYRIYRYESSTKAYQYIGTSNTTSYVDNTVAANTKYCYKVSAMAKNAPTETAMSSKVQIMVPGAVNVSITSVNNKYLRLDWNRNAKAAGYVIYRSSKKSSGYKKIATITSNKKLYYKDKTVKPGRTYYYRVKSYTKNGEKMLYSFRSNTVKGKIIVNSKVQKVFRF